MLHIRLLVRRLRFEIEIGDGYVFDFGFWGSWF
jgi:hypothetical protein